MMNIHIYACLASQHINISLAGVITRCSMVGVIAFASQHQHNLNVLKANSNKVPVLQTYITSMDIL